MIQSDFIGILDWVKKGYMKFKALAKTVMALLCIGRTKPIANNKLFPAPSTLIHSHPAKPQLPAHCI